MGNILDMEKVGRNISVLRKKQGMTQMALADKLLISYQAVSNWERGVTMPDIAKLPELAEIFGVTVDDILESGKGAQIIEAAVKGETVDAISTDDVIEVAPILKPEQVDALVKSASGGVTPAQADKLMPTLSFDGDYDKSNEVLAERFYANGEVMYFAIIIAKLSIAKQKEYAIRAFNDGAMPFLAIAIPYIDRPLLNEMADKAYAQDKIAEFSVLMGLLSGNDLNVYRNKAFADNKDNFISVMQDGE